MKLLASAFFVSFMLLALLVPARAQGLADADNIIMRLRPVCNGGQGSSLVIALDIKKRGGTGNRIGGYTVVLTYVYQKMVFQGAQQRYQQYWQGAPWYIDTDFGSGARFNQHSTSQGNPGGALPLTNQYWSVTTDCSGNPLNDGFFEVLRWTFQVGASANGYVDFGMYDNLRWRSGITFQHGGQWSAIYYSDLQNNGNDSSLVIKNLMIPVELAALNASPRPDRTVELTWRTESETSNIGFDIERGDGKNFVKIGHVQGRGTTSEKTEYSYIDESPVSTDGRDMVFYRLKQIDADGTETYSYIVSAQLDPGNVGLENTYPNPVSSGDGVTIPYTLAVPATVHLDVHNALGQRVASIEDGVARNAGRFEARWDGRVNGQPAAPGMYFVRFNANVGGDQVVATRQIGIIR
ncbi:MAG: T9SS type A sorting domain-containing protein [Ignavibacteriae bacterium]|nr:T9SS type A sorting domain-containing protein [Ignavibacteriota bacterium]